MPFTPRLASTDDVTEIVRLRRELFESLGLTTGSGWEDSCLRVIEKGLAEGWLIAVVVDAPDGEGAAAVGTAELQQRLPGPDNPSGIVGYVGTMSTVERWQRRGIGRAVLDHLVDELRARGVTRIELHATPVAESLYREAGFAERPGGLEMRLLHP